MMTASDYYVPTKRSHHSTHIVGDNLYMWGGDIDGLPEVHNIEMKQKMTSVIEIFHLPTGMWEQRPTNGKPPLGVIDYASTVFGNSIYYFGGYCNHSGCFHNSLNTLTTDSLLWNELYTTSQNIGPMMKRSSGMISLTFNKVELLLVFGGIGRRPTSPQPSAQYKKVYGENVHTNEHHYYHLANGYWVVPDVTGAVPPPCNSFTLTSLPNMRALLFGGDTPNGFANSVYICQCTKTAVHWETLSEPLPNSVNWPQTRQDHAATIISDLHIMFVGGSGTYDSWLFNINTKTWTKLALQESVTKRERHTLSAWILSPNTVWVIQFGGYRLFDELNDTTVIELICKNEEWSVGNVITNLKPTKVYQRNLQQKKQKISLQSSGRHGQNPLTVQFPTHLQDSFPPHEGSQGNNIEIEGLLQQLELTNKELHDTKQVASVLQEDVQTNERQLQRLHHDLQEKQQLITELQQTQDTLQLDIRHHENRERLLQQQLQDQEERGQQQLQESQKKEIVLRQANATLQQQVQEKRQLITELYQTRATLQLDIQNHKNKERLLQKQLQDQEERKQQQLQYSQERERVLRQANATLQQQVQQLQDQEERRQQQLQYSQERERVLCQANATLQQQVQQLQDQSHWVVRREEIEMTEEVLGKGGWGEVKVAKFRGLRVAAKCLHEVILSPYNISVFTREMEIAARVRHPNLLQFIGSTRVGTPIILSELLPTSLRKEIEKSLLNGPQIIKIAQDVSTALNYLHLWKPHPILHRDVSSPNVLLEPYGSVIWKAKLSDYGSANLVQSISANSVAPGNPFYSAPEAPFPDQHSPSMDVFSFGVLLMEMILHQPPASKTADKMAQSEIIQWPAMKHLVRRCISPASQARPSIAEVLADLEHP